MSNVTNSGSENTKEILSQDSGSRAAFPRLAAVITAMMGLVVLAGWAFAIPVLKSVLPGAVEMKANTAVGLVLAACALFVLCARPSLPLRRLAQALALAVAALGLATLGQYLFAWELGIDELLFRDTAGAYNSIRGRMSPYSSVAFALIGLGLAALPRPALRPLVRLASGFVMAVGAVTLLGYLWNASELVTDFWLPPVAVNTACAFLLLGAGLLLANRAHERQHAADYSVVRGPIETRILAGFVGALGLLFVASGYSYRTSAEFAESARWVAHTQQVRAELGQFDATIAEAESAQRSYLLTGETQHKVEYAQLAAEVDGHVQNLSRLVADNPTQIRNLEELRPLVVERMNALARQVSLFERQGRGAALAAIARDNAIQAPRSIDELEKRIDNVEKELLTGHETEFGRSRELSLVALLVMLALATSLLTVLFRGIRREMAARAQSDKELRASEEYTRSIIDSSPDCVMVLTLDARLDYMGVKGRQLMEVHDPQIIENIDMLAFWTGEVHAAAQSAIAAARNGRSERFQGYWPTFKGKPKRWDVIVSPILDANGRVKQLLVVSRDITEYKQAEDHLNRFFSLSLDMLCISSADGYFKRISPAFTKTLGWNTEEILARPFLDFVHPDDRAATLREVERQVKAGDNVLQFENRYLHKDGSWRVLSWKSVPYEGGLMFATARDITEIKAAADQVRDSAARLQAILDTVAEGVITIDGRGNVETVNPAAERVFGYAAAEVLGHNIKLLMPEPYHSQHDAYLEHYRATGEARIIGRGREVTGRRKDGSTFPLDLAVSEMILHGEPHFTGIVRDITARKQAEQALKLETGRLDLALRSAGMAMWNFDLTAGRVSLDERWAEIIGAEPGASDTTPGDLLKLVPAEHRDRLVAAAAEITSGRASRYRVEHQVLTRSGELHWIESVGEVVERDAQGRALRMIGLNHDITERKRVEHALLDAKIEAEQANAAKDSFLATMSHEIRTPLNGLLGMLELLGLSHLDGEQRDSLQIARESGRGLVRIIDDVLDHAKIEAGKLELRVGPVSIAQLLRQVRNTYDAVASAKDLTLTEIVDPRISPSLLADPLRVTQILNNLVSNALKFTADGYVEIQAELLGRADGADTVRLAVKDTGIGMAPEVQQRLFQPFEQAGAITARLYGGTGLGLSICLRLAEMMGGTIEVKSAPGAGTTMSVTLTLPISNAAAAELDHAATPAVLPIRAAGVPGAGPLVLAVDDHPTNRELLARQIAALGLRVHTATDGRDALALWQADRYALIISDCNMQQMDGYALSRVIRELEASERRPRTPIIAWTANVLPSTAALCHAAGMDDILTKPAELAALKKMLSKWLPSAAMATADPIDVEHAESDATQAASIEFANLNKIAATPTERAEILLDFMTQTRSDFAALRAALTLQDLQACVRVAHRMKGSSRMVGARDFATACETMERAARQGSAQDAATAWSAMDRALERLEVHFAETTDAKEKTK